MNEITEAFSTTQASIHSTVIFKHIYQHFFSVFYISFMKL